MSYDVCKCGHPDWFHPVKSCHVKGCKCEEYANTIGYDSMEGRMTCSYCHEDYNGEVVNDGACRLSPDGQHQNKGED